MSKKSKGKDYIDDGLKIPFEYVEKIDRMIKTGISKYPSRDEFIKGAVEIKLAQIKTVDKK